MKPRADTAEKPDSTFLRRSLGALEEEGERSGKRAEGVGDNIGGDPREREEEENDDDNDNDGLIFLRKVEVNVWRNVAACLQVVSWLLIVVAVDCDSSALSVQLPSSVGWRVRGVVKRKKRGRCRCIL